MSDQGLHDQCGAYRKVQGRAGKAPGLYQDRNFPELNPGPSAMAAYEMHSHKPRNERQLLNPRHLKALEDKESVLEIQRMILSRLASEENRMKGIAGHCSGLTERIFAQHAKEAIEALSTLSY